MTRRSEGVLGLTMPPLCGEGMKPEEKGKETDSTSFLAFYTT